MFASLIERLLARFSFDATDTRITIRHPGRSSFTLNIPSIRYETESGISSTNESSTPHATLRNDITGETRIIIFSGVEITMLDLQHEDIMKPVIPSIVSSVNSLPQHPPYGHPPPKPRSRSPSPDSDIDDETQMMMSQSIAFLPPQPLSSSSISASVASSMYQSAVSEAPVRSTPIRDPVPELQGQPSIESAANTEEKPSSSPQDQQPLPSDAVPPEGASFSEETIVSFGTDPIVIRITTPPSSDLRPGQQRSEDREDSVHLSVAAGVISLPLRARHIQGLAELVAALGRVSPTSPRPPKPQGTTQTPTLLSRLKILVSVRGVVGLLLLAREPSHELIRTGFFHHPLIPPKLSHAYLRIHADGISASLSQSLVVGRGERRATGTTRMDASLTMTDLTIFTFEPTDGPSLGSEHIASPVLITDPNVLTQYTPSHAHPVNQHNPYPSLPTFDVSDWTNVANKSTTPKPSYWRARIPQNHAHQRMASHGRGGSVGVLGLSHSPGKSNPDFLQKTPTQSPSAVFVTVTVISGSHKLHSRERPSESRAQVEAKVAPLHAFADLGVLLSNLDYGLLEFVRGSIPTILPPTLENPNEELYGEISDEDEKDTPPATPRRFTSFSRRDSDRQRERQRLEQTVLDELDLKFDYRTSTPKQSSQPLPSEKVRAWREVMTHLVCLR